MISDFVVDLQIFLILSNHRQRFAVVAGLQMTRAAGLNWGRRGILQHVSGKNDFSFRSNQRSFQIFFRLIGVVTFDTRADAFAVDRVVFRRVVRVIESRFPTAS